MTIAQDTGSDVSLRLAQRLVRQGRLDQPLAKTALAHAREHRQRFEDALIDCGVSEHILLRHLADLYRTQLISTEKLENAKLSPRVLRMVPKNLAERHLVVPIVLTANGELVVATPDPESVDLVKDVQLASQAREVKTTVARPAAVLAAIRKFYDGDMHAFRSLTEVEPVTQGLAMELTDNQGSTSIATATLSERPPPPLPDPHAARFNRKPSAPRHPQAAGHPASQQQARARARPDSGRQPAPSRKPSTEALEMAPPTASGAATTGSVAPLSEPFPLASDSMFPAPTVTRSQQPTPSKRKAHVASAPELELALDDNERARLPESGRDRHADPVLQSMPQPRDAPLMAGAGLAEGPDYSQFGGASLPPALGGFFASSPPAANPSSPASDLAGSLPPSLGFFPSSPPDQASGFGSGSSPPIFEASDAARSNHFAPSLEPMGATSGALPSHQEPGSTPPALGFLSSAPPAAVSTSPVAPNSLQQWMAALDSSPPPDTHTAPAVLSGPPVASPLSIPPIVPGAQQAAPYAFTPGHSLVQAPLSFARSFAALCERPHGALAAHSIVLSELTRLLAAQIGWAQSDQEEIELASLLHDMGKSKSRHLTLFSASYYVEYEQIARQQYLLPLQLFAASGLPDSVIRALTHLYERVDGGGFPNGLRGSEIPIMSQLISLCDSYLDLTLHAHNPFGRVLAPHEALTALNEKAGALFDATLVERLSQLILANSIDVRTRQRQVTL